LDQLLAGLFQSSPDLLLPAQVATAKQGIQESSDAHIVGALTDFQVYLEACGVNAPGVKRLIALFGIFSPSFTGTEVNGAKQIGRFVALARKFGFHEAAAKAIWAGLNAPVRNAYARAGLANPIENKYSKGAAYFALMRITRDPGWYNKGDNTVSEGSVGAIAKEQRDLIAKQCGLDTTGWSHWPIILCACSLTTAYAEAFGVHPDAVKEAAALRAAMTTLGQQRKDKIAAKPKIVVVPKPITFAQPSKVDPMATVVNVPKFGGPKVVDQLGGLASMLKDMFPIS
jgi:hypothetical protein